MLSAGNDTARTVLMIVIMIWNAGKTYTGRKPQSRVIRKNNTLAATITAAIRNKITLITDSMRRRLMFSYNFQLLLQLAELHLPNFYNRHKLFCSKLRCDSAVHGEQSHRRLR